MGYDQKRYDEALQKAANKSFNGDLIKSRQMIALLKPKWPDLEWGFFNERDLPSRLSDSGGSWMVLTVAMWQEWGEWNEQMAMRHGLVEKNGALMMPPGHIICWRPKWFGEKLRAISNQKTNERLSVQTAESQASGINQRLGRKVATAQLDVEYQRAVVRPDAIDTDPEFHARHAEPKIQIAVPEKKVAPKPRRKPGRKPKHALVDKPPETT